MAKRSKPPTKDTKAPADDTQAKLWEGRLTRANKVFERWEKDYECQHLDDYYEGKQWRGTAENDAKKKYVINLVFATVETQLPTLLFTKPKVKCEARPSHEQTDTSQAGARATLIEQSVQTVIDDPRVRFSYETDLALRDAYPRFAVIEVGYSADWIDNPNADKPILKEDGSPLMDGQQAVFPAKQLLKKGTKESVYIRRIDPATFRASPGHNALTSNDWVGYYEWHQLDDVTRNTEYQNTSGLQATGMLKPTADEELERQRDEDTQQHLGMVKLWKIWDLREKVRLVHAEGHGKLLQRKAYKNCPLAVLKFYERRNAFYPLPPIYNWLGPQDEINETREMQKVHRRRALRRYMHDGSVLPAEMEKLESGEDMVVVQVGKTVPPPIAPIQDAPLDLQNWTELAASRDDLNQISGVMGESRNSPQAETATQANILNVRASIRESRARQQVADWLGEIARLILLTLRERMKLPFMVKQTVDPFAAAKDPEQVLSTAGLWKQIESDQLDLDVDVTIDVASLSPVAEDAQRQQWDTVLALLTNPALATILMTPNPNAPQDPSPMLRKTLTLHGITSDQEIREVWRVGRAIMAQAAAAAASQAALAKQPEPIKMSLALKGEDLMNPLLGPFFMQLIAREEGLPAEAAAMAQPENPVISGDNSSMSLSSPNGLASGMPAKSPMGVQ